MKRYLLIFVIVIVSGIVLSSCSDDDCGDCTTKLITQDISIDGATLQIYDGRPTIYTEMQTGNYKEVAYCFICNENKAKKLIEKVRNGGTISVNVRGKFRELRDGEPNLSKYDGFTQTRITSCDIEILKIKKQ